MHFISKVFGDSSMDFTERQYPKFSRESASMMVLATLGRRKKVATAKKSGMR